MAVGTYKGEHALAVGYGRRLTNNKIEVKLGASINSRSDVNAGGSVGYHW
nr:YadA C-terminal domain-containing protein [Haemophilus haemolyticus]